MPRFSAVKGFILRKMLLIFVWVVEFNNIHSDNITIMFIDKDRIVYQLNIPFLHDLGYYLLISYAWPIF